MPPEILLPANENVYWNLKLATNPEVDRILTLRLNATPGEISGLQHSVATASNYYICEVEHSNKKKENI